MNGVIDSGMVGLEGLDKNIGGVEVATADAANNLGKKLKSALFGGIIGEGEAGVGLDDAYGGK